MRVAHYVRLHWLASLLCFSGSLLLVVSSLGLDPTEVRYVGGGGLLAGIGLFALLQAWLNLKVGTGLQHPKSEEGYPVSPSGVWVDEDTPLEPGSRVLAFWQGYWWRAEVVSLRAGGRVMVRYRGWDRAWDEVHKRTQLQFDAGEGQADHDVVFDTRRAPPRDQDVPG